MISPASLLSGSRVLIDLDALASNTAQLRRRAGNAEVMAIVKANAYGHGMVPCARAALAGGATWLGAAQIDEALVLRAELGMPAPILAWLYPPDGRFSEAIAADIDLGVSSLGALEVIASAARDLGRPARIHLKVDTGLGRSGAQPATWPELVERALGLQAEGSCAIVGCWSHLAYADAPDHPTIAAQKEVFAWAVEAAERMGARFEVRHLANSALLLTDPSAAWDMVRPGLALYGLSPMPGLASSADLGLRPVMTWESQLVLVKAVPGGHGVSYGHEYVTASDTTLGLVPLGYADGVPRHLSNVGPVWVGGRRLRVSGRVCMDQFVVDLGAGAREVAGDPVVLLGPGDRGEPTADDWAAAAGTISYEITTRIPAHVRREYVGGAG
ncbi:MAG: alanine racemase [Micrococcales bacterium]|nr:alanine racemase [Micrococcales bacterium]